METFFNDQEISEFLGHYSINDWCTILRSLTLFSIHTLMSRYSKDQYPSVKEIQDFFEKNNGSSKFLYELANVYKDLHRVDKQIRKMVDGVYNRKHSQSRHSSSNKKSVINMSLDAERKAQAIIKSQPNKKVITKPTPENVDNTVRPRSPISRNDLINNCKYARTGNTTGCKNRSVLQKNEFNSMKSNNSSIRPQPKQVSTCRESVDSSNKKYEQWLSEASGRKIAVHRLEPRSSVGTINERHTLAHDEQVYIKENYYRSEAIPLGKYRKCKY